MLLRKGRSWSVSKRERHLHDLLVQSQRDVVRGRDAIDGHPAGLRPGRCGGPGNNTSELVEGRTLPLGVRQDAPRSQRLLT
jgi:hypothetical protein